MPKTKLDTSARNHWGQAYDAIPKSVFAVAAWHLANLASESCNASGEAEHRFMEEISALADNDLIPERQVRAAIRAVKRELGRNPRKE